ncbi:hypothetical protein BVC80_1321g40 [Macleaya cordata]|uniref:Ethylene insensitive 3-like DNA-binding domain-containing protein n=1 Tax=Macleaya cordata TaxID=56857 RepID=A0A200Q097_MACCD|nr:hypothetical protein BVC80_1321g40 [Macleaya cordata]
MMGIFEDMGFNGNLEFLSSVPPVEVDFAPETEPEATVEEDYSDEEMDVDELERRMWRDRMLLRRLKEQNKGKEGVDTVKQRQSQEQARRKKMSRAQDGILKYMLKMMEVCKAQGFVYGIIPEKGKPVSGASDNLRAWWKEKVRFDRNGPAAIAKYQADHAIPGVEDDNIEAQDCKPRDVNLFNLGMGGIGGAKERILVQPPPPIKGEIINSDFIRKRKPANDPETMMDNKIYTCEYTRCPYSDYRHGFLDRTSRNNHQAACSYRSISPGFGISTNFHVNEEKPPVFSLPFAPPNPAAVQQNTNLNPPSFNLTGLGLPEDGQKMINELMSFYDTNFQQNKNPNAGNIGGAMVEDQNPMHTKVQFDENFYGQGVNVGGMGGNIFEEASTPMNQTMFPREEIQFDQSFESNPSDITADFRFGSPFNLASVDYTEVLSRGGMESSSFQKQDNSSIWYL